MDLGVDLADLVDFEVDFEVDLVDLGRISSGKVLSGKVSPPMEASPSPIPKTQIMERSLSPLTRPRQPSQFEPTDLV